MRNKIKLFICVMSTLLSTNIYAQTKDSLELKVYVEKITKDSSSSFYYPKLLDKVKNQPSELNVDDCFFLYYGQIFQKGHNVLSFIANPERAKFIRAVMNEDCETVVKLGIIMLERNPVDLTVLLHVRNCIKGKTDNYYFEQRYNNLLSAILSTGSGKTMKTSIKIVNVEDDYVLKGTLGFLGGEEKFGFDKNHFYSIWEKEDQKLYFEDVMTIGN